ncbi:MAG: MFS transporter [Desulfovibrionaceae bacterium]|nr:MFS transporter [Desulfovibrionaceae bacterium]
MDNTTRAWCIFITLSMATLFSSTQQVGLATVSGEVASAFAIGPAELGTLAAAFTYTYALMQIPAGMLSDILGCRRVIPVFLSIGVAGMLVFALSPSFGGAVFGRFLTGLGLVMISAPLLKMTAVWFPAHRFGMLTAISLVFGGVGYWAATTPMAYAASLWGWRNTFLGCAAIFVLLIVAVLIFVRDAPEGANASVPESRVGLGELMRGICSQRQLWIVALWHGIQGGIYFSFIGLWGGQYLMRVHGISSIDTAWVLSLSSCTIMLTPVFTGIAARTGRKPVFLVLPMINIALFGILYMGVDSWAPAALAVYFCVIAIASISACACIFDAGQALFPVSMAGTVGGFINMCPFCCGAILQQVFGVIVDRGIAGGETPAQAFSGGFLFYAVLSCATVLLTLAYRENPVRCERKQ